MPDCIVGVIAAVVAVTQVLTLAWYVRRWLQRRRTTWLAVAHYVLTFGLLFGVLYWSRTRGQDPAVVAAGYGFGLILALSAVVWNAERAQAQQRRSEE